MSHARETTTKNYQNLPADVRALLERMTRQGSKPRGVKLTPKKERPRCGARRRDGGTCQARAVWNNEENEPKNGRCRMHGGASTGPKTPEGRARIAAAARRMQLARWGARQGGA